MGLGCCRTPALGWPHYVRWEARDEQAVGSQQDAGGVWEVCGSEAPLKPQCQLPYPESAWTCMSCRRELLCHR